jgi:iron complex transport system ATP-binding protein
VTVLIGPNGAGKSTLLGALAGDVKLAAGRVTLDGAAIADMRPATLAARRAVLAQSTELAFPFTVDEVVRLGLPPMPRDEADAIALRCLETVDLVRAKNRSCLDLSGGERQRAHLARVLAQLAAAPKGAASYLFLDEPIASLDLDHQMATLALARRHAEAGGGVLAVLHDLNMAVMAADEIVGLRQGRIVLAGPPEQVLTDEAVQALYGVQAQVRGVPEGPFLLPQTIRQGRAEAR